MQVARRYSQPGNVEGELTRLCRLEHGICIRDQCASQEGDGKVIGERARVVV